MIGRGRIMLRVVCGGGAIKRGRMLRPYPSYVGR
jgi:hypothetical protein